MIATGSMNPMIWTMVPPPFQQMEPAPWFPPLRFHLKAMDVEDSCVITHEHERGYLEHDVIY
ncbi:hypothetical protein HanHA300_Chr10g0357161 [Helianthus annuus]|nr:hypothetical protein HanHA300_Chr10g0357161 [Helianthus annuus]KAJ0529515.1 hypothetical protein HanHA89_Chr10g0378771 [Helianthus annuus]KAJ0696400.1 hypothetical protein HanLR1_Chr10g0356671 [Helianthus annuus]